MITPDRLRAMTPAERFATFERLLRESYGASMQDRERFAQDFEMHAFSLYRWKRKPETIPAAVIYALSARVEAKASALEWLAETTATALQEMRAGERNSASSNSMPRSSE